jgi:hypothetical protein
MLHPIYRVQSFQIEAPYTLRVRFDDGTEQVIDFRPILAGAMYGPLRNLPFSIKCELILRFTRSFGRMARISTPRRFTIGPCTHPR